MFTNAAGRWERFEVPWEQAQALLGQSRCLLTLGRPTEAREPLRRAATLPFQVLAVCLPWRLWRRMRREQAGTGPMG